MTEQEKTTGLMIPSNKMYDKLKYVAQVLLPAVGTLYFAIAQIWGLSHANEVVGTIVAIDTFLGVVLHISSNSYKNSDARYDGTVEVTDSGDKKTFLLNVDSDLDELDKKDTLNLKVNKVKPMKAKVSAKRKRTANS